ncbi:MAG: SAM-dependent methyltransferase [Betaproteobacteria bacterium]
MSGTVYLVPNLLGVAPPESVLPSRTLAVARSLRHWRVETPKAARAFLKTLALDVALASLDIEPIPDGASPAASVALLAPAGAGGDVGVLSDAGCPGIADPGAALVAAAHRMCLRVVPLVGPSAILLALMASGMNGQRFAFHGYLPVKPEARAAALRALEQDSLRERRAHAFIETPYRNVGMLQSVAATLAASTDVCVAVDLTLESEIVERHAAPAWREADLARFDKRPAVFVLLARTA